MLYDYTNKYYDYIYIISKYLQETVINNNNDRKFRYNRKQTK